MVHGQGSPRPLEPSAQLHEHADVRAACLLSIPSSLPKLISSFSFVIRLAILAATSASGFWISSHVVAEEPTYRMHIAWGGGQPRAWEGQIEISEGEIFDIQLLGLQPDQASSVYLTDDEPSRILIRHILPRTYDGVEFSVKAPAGATFQITLRDRKANAKPKTAEIPLADVLKSVQNQSLDDQENRLLVRRAPGDDIRVHFDRDTMLFNLGETFEVTVEPFHLRVPERIPMRLDVTLQPARGDEILWSDTVSIKLDLTGSCDAVGPILIPIPESEGVYDIVFRVRRARLRDAFVVSKPLASRRLQIVALGHSPTDFEAEGPVESNPEPPLDFDQVWQPIETWHPTDTGWTEWLAQIPALPWINTTFSRKPLSNKKTVVRDAGNHAWIELQPEGWQAYPLPITDRSRPHILEIEYPLDAPQSLGISIVEPDASGQVMNVGLDSGVQVPWSGKLLPSEPGFHRLLFWPKSETPLVVIVNHDPNRIARFGRIRVLAGPDHLPATANKRQLHDKNGRFAGVYFHKPFWPATFSATQGLDENTGRSLDDWQTFYEAGTRLVEYLRHTGYGGAVICVATEGSAMYPSRHLAPNPKFDTGVFFTTGQDPIRKDVVELLMRLFERESLTLIPAIELSAPLPELEAIRRRSTNPSLFLHNGSHAWQQRGAGWKGMMPPYNPLDPDVQTAVTNVMQELTTRYEQHPSFGGIAWLVGGQGMGLFPGSEWGRDIHTWQQFQAEVQEEPSEDTSDKPLSQTQWLQWRSEKLLEFHRHIQRSISSPDDPKRLWIMTADLFAEDNVKESMRPELFAATDFRQLLLRWGLDPQRYRDEEHILMVQPKRQAPPFDPASFATSYQQRTQQWDNLFQGYRVPGVLFFHEPLWRALPSFDELSPFGSDRTQLTVFSHLAQPDILARQRFVQSLAAADSQYFFDGGWGIPLGNELALRPLLETWQSLPAKTFQDVSSKQQGAADSEVTIRILHENEYTYMYLVNSAPWPVEASLTLQYPDGATIEVLGPHEGPTVIKPSGQQNWQIKLDPCGLYAVRLNTPSFRVLSWRSSGGAQIGGELANAIRNLRAQTNALRNPQPIAVLKNASFESADKTITGWVAAQGPEITVETVDTTSYDGQQALHAKSTKGIAWIRSEPLPAPRTGRFFVMARLKAADPNQQPPLRLAIDGRRKGLPYYRSARVGDGEGAPKLAADWGTQPFLLPITNLPTSGWTDFRIGFDLMGPGEVWIDDVQVYDMYFLLKERQELMLRVAVHESSVAQARWMGCYQFLDSYWPQILFNYLDPPPARVAREPTIAAPPRVPVQPESSDQSDRSLMDRFRPRWPRNLFPF